MVDLVVHHIKFAYIRAQNMVLILTRVFIVGFTGWLVLNRDQNRLVRKKMVDLVVKHIEFAYIRPLKMVLIIIGVFKEHLTAWLS